MLRRVVLAALCVAASLFAQPTKAPPKRPAPPTGLKVLLATLNPVTNQIAVQLNNSTNKTVVAYMLSDKGLDASGKALPESMVGWDFAGPEPNNEATKYILPGQTVSVQLDATPGMSTVEVSVAGVVYEDRTAEGLVQAFFITRGKHATEARQALDLMKSYPGTRSEMREKTKSLLAFKAAHLDAVMANHLNLRAPIDEDHPPEQVSRQQWGNIRTQLEREAAWYETQAQGEK